MYYVFVLNCLTSSFKLNPSVFSNICPESLNYVSNLTFLFRLAAIFYGAGGASDAIIHSHFFSPGPWRPSTLVVLPYVPTLPQA